MTSSREVVASILAPMLTSQAGRALVADGRQVVGIVSPSDIARTVHTMATASGVAV